MTYEEIAQLYFRSHGREALIFFINDIRPPNHNDLTHMTNIDLSIIAQYIVEML